MQRYLVTDTIGPHVNVDRLRVLLYEHRILQRDFAAAAGFTECTLNRLLNHRAVPTLEHRYCVTYALRVLGLDDGTVISGKDALQDYTAYTPQRQPTLHLAASPMSRT